MKINVSENYEELSEKAATMVTDLLNKKKNAVITIAGGDTPMGLCRQLVKKANEGKADFSACHFVGLDEWVGMDMSDKGSCQDYMYNNLFIPLGLRSDQITFFDAKSSDLVGECKKVDDEVHRLGGIDLIVLGIGMNGHLGFNEPGVSENLRTHFINLDEVTKVVGQKYFSDKKRLTQGISLGLKCIMESGRVLLIANGRKKASIIKQTAEGEISNQIPSSLVRRHADAHLYIDREAAEELTNCN